MEALGNLSTIEIAEITTAVLCTHSNRRCFLSTPTHLKVQDTHTGRGGEEGEAFFALDTV